MADDRKHAPSTPGGCAALAPLLRASATESASKERSQEKPSEIDHGKEVAPGLMISIALPTERRKCAEYA